MKDYFYSSSDVSDSDGYVDFIVQGDDADYYSITQIFVNNPDNSTFSLVENTGNYPLGSQGNIRLFHLNGDNNLDILSSGFNWSSGDYPSLTKVFSNTSTFQNQQPQPPSELNLTLIDNRLNFSWNGATDDTTPTSTLQYELTVGKTQNGQEIAKYVVTTPCWFLELDEIPENVFWSVKTKDQQKFIQKAQKHQI